MRVLLKSKGDGQYLSWILCPDGHYEWGFSSIKKVAYDFSHESYSMIDVKRKEYNCKIVTVYERKTYNYTVDHTYLIPVPKNIPMGTAVKLSYNVKS